MGNALHKPSKTGNIEALRKLIDENPKINVNSKNKSGNTALHKASKYGHSEIVDEFVSRHGVDINVKNREGYTPLHISSMFGKSETVTRLIALGADINAVGGTWKSTSLHWACIHSHEETAKVLIAHGADLNIKDDVGRLPLQYVKDEGMRSNLVRDDFEQLNCFSGCCKNYKPHEYTGRSSS